MFYSEHVIIPRTENTIKCMVVMMSGIVLGLISADINSELDELDREEFFRLKKACNFPCMAPVHTNTTNRFRTRSKEIPLLKMRRCLQDEPQRRKEEAIKKTPKEMLTSWESRRMQMSFFDQPVAAPTCRLSTTWPEHNRAWRKG